MSSPRLSTLPDPPDHLSEEARRTWIEAGIKLLRADRLTEESLKKLSDLCYWEDQRSSVMDKLREDQSTGVKTTSGPGRSVHLKNLKAVKLEIDIVRDQLGLEKTESDLTADIPILPEEAIESLPPQLESCCRHLRNQDKRDLLLLAMLPLISAHLPNLLAEHANGYYTPSINIFLLDGSGAGKQLAGKAKTLAYGDLATPAQPEESMVRTIRDELDHFTSGRASHKRMRIMLETDLELLLGDDSSAIESERFKQVFGRVFTAVPLVIRPGMGELSALMIGDMEQFKKLSLKTGPDFFTSFLVYASHRRSAWQSNRPDTSSRALNKDLASLGSDLARIKSILSGRRDPLTVELSSSQWQMIDDTFAEKMEIIDELGLPAELHNVNRKTAIYTLKLSAVFTALRAFDHDSESLAGEYLTPADDDVIAALWTADTCLKHAIRLHEILPGNKETDARGERYVKYHNILPATFATADALELADKLNIPGRTAKRYLNALVDEKKVARVKRGLYKKIS